MNKKQRTALQKITISLTQLLSQVESIMEEEQGKIDNLPESLMGSSKEDEYQEAVDALTEAMDSLQSTIDVLEQFSS